jgi:2-polyprenyl-3-methyl-5-hydroxy-6-metoxy-1,4-benzoquinol methylase
MSIRADHEISHGKKLSAGDTESIWGWGTPAGKVRAQRRGQLVAQGARLQPNMRVMEIGCGTGLFTEIFCSYGAHITAVDISPDLLDIARKRKIPGEVVTFKKARFEEWPKDDQFEAMIGSSILHHLEIDQALSTMYALLKPGGRISFAEPNMMNPQVFAERKFRRFFPNTSPDETAFIRWRLRKQLDLAGFEDIRITPFDWLHPATPRPMIGFVSVLGKFLERIPGVREFSGSLLISATKLAAK